MSKGNLKPEDESCIQHNYTYLKKELDAMDLVDYLYEKKVLTRDDKETIRSGTNKSERNEHFLQMLLNAGPGDAFEYFLQSLKEKYSHVLVYIKRKAVHDTTIEKQKEEIKQLTEDLCEANQKLRDYEESVQGLRDHYEQTTLKLRNYENKFNTMEVLCETALRTLLEYKENYDSIKQQYGITNKKLESYEQKFSSMEVLLDAVSSKFWGLANENQQLKETDQNNC